MKTDRQLRPEAYRDERLPGENFENYKERRKFLQKERKKILRRGFVESIKTNKDDQKN